MSKISYEKLGDGIALYKPVKSRFWWCRVRVDNHPAIKEIRKSLKTEDKNRAIYEAQKIALETEIKIKENIDLMTSKPKAWKIAEKAKIRLERAKPAKPTYPGYIRILEKEIIPFLKELDKNITEINRYTVEDFFDKYEKNSKTQVNMSKTCFKRVFEEGLREQWIEEKNIPKMPKVEIKETEEKRNHFNEEELATLHKRIDEYIGNSRKSVSKENRFLLKCMMLFLEASGARTGEECKIKWDDLEVIKKDGIKAVMCKISKGKTKGKGGRKIILDGQAIEAIELVFNYQLKGIEKIEKVVKTPFFEYYDYSNDRIDFFDFIDEAKKKLSGFHIFERKDRKEIDFSKTFELYIKWLREEELIGNKNHTLYSFRHTFITSKLMEKEEKRRWTAEQVAKHCGNSLQMIWDYYLHLQAEDTIFNFDYYIELRNKTEKITGA
ncbi:MAG: hypothetical protein COA94_08025 [Rickettsiales bacterium]|nr:MAG: hypothetical protein COA94_08025 [Rickettsiales bacterium]